MRVELVRAWPRRAERIALDLAVGATVADAFAAVRGASPRDAWQDGDGVAVFGERVDDTHVLQEGDRIEVLRPLQVDPKQARRRRAERTRG